MKEQILSKMKSTGWASANLGYYVQLHAMTTKEFKKHLRIILLQEFYKSILGLWSSDGCSIRVRIDEHTSREFETNIGFIRKCLVTWLISIPQEMKDLSDTENSDTLKHEGIFLQKLIVDCGKVIAIGKKRAFDTGCWATFLKERKVTKDFGIILDMIIAEKVVGNGPLHYQTIGDGSSIKENSGRVVTLFHDRVYAMFIRRIRKVIDFMELRFLLHNILYNLSYELSLAIKQEGSLKEDTLVKGFHDNFYRNPNQQ